jgi:hypothetical protein
MTLKHELNSMNFKKEIEINLLIFGIVLFFQRMAMPYVNYIFIPYLIFISIYFMRKILTNKDKIHIGQTVLKAYFPLLLIAVILVIAFVFSKQHNMKVFKDILQFGVLMVLIIIVSIEIKNQKEFKQFTLYFVIQVVISSGFISILGLTKLLVVLFHGNLNFLKGLPLYNSSLNDDYNFYCLSNILGIISILNLLAARSNRKSTNLLLQVLLFILSLSVIFSNSRRGFVFFLIFFASIIILNLHIPGKAELFQVKTRLFLFLNSVFILFMAFYISTYNTRMFFNFKRSTFNLNLINNTIFNLSYRYGSVFRMDKNNIDRLLRINYDSRYPYTRWGLRVHDEVYPLKGQNVEIVPKGSVGYKMDSTCNTDSWTGNAYSFTGISQLYKDDTLNLSGDTYLASVCCFVSNNFNGSWVSIAAEGKAFGKKQMYYDLNAKNIWQRLDIVFQSQKSIPPVFLYMTKEKVTNFNSLTGYVIFAFPEYKKVNKNRANSKDFTFPSKTGYLNKTSFIENDLFIDIFRKIEYILFQKQSIGDTISTGNFSLRNPNEFSSSRTERWRYGFFLFSKEYSLKQKIIGNGFVYMNKFGSKFGESKLDYPHNPFIDSFLYSGIIGGLVYIWFMFLVFYYYIKYYKYHIYYFICFLLVFYFTFVSANTHFSVPIFAFLSIIPFLTKYIIEKERAVSDTNESKSFT